MPELNSNICILLSLFRLYRLLGEGKEKLGEGKEKLGEGKEKLGEGKGKFEEGKGKFEEGKVKLGAHLRKTRSAPKKNWERS